jgi:hypothetical protein
MKLKSKRLLLVIAILAVVGIGIAAYAAFNVTSNVVRVTLSYHVDLYVSVSSSTATLDAYVYNATQLQGAGIPVAFYVSINGGAYGGIATVNTDGGGHSQTTYAMTQSSATYDFEAIASIP